MKMVYRIKWIGFLLIGLLCQCNSATNQNSKQNQNESTAEVTESIIDTTVESEYPSIDIQENQILISATKINVNSEGKWGGFEGELGTIELFDDQNHAIGMCVLSTTENWMVNGPVNYSCEFIYTASSSGKGRLIIKNNNPTGEAQYDKSFELQVNYKKEN